MCLVDIGSLGTIQQPIYFILLFTIPTEEITVRFIKCYLGLKHFLVNNIKEFTNIYDIMKELERDYYLGLH